MSLSINTNGTAAKVVKETVSHKRFITVWDRTTEFDDGRIIQWDVVGHDTPYPTFVVVFTFDTTKVSRSCLFILSSTNKFNN